jgi:hypothetical protein
MTCPYLMDKLNCCRKKEKYIAVKNISNAFFSSTKASHRNIIPVQP